MKILMISKSGDGFGILQKLKAEGHDVRIWVKEKGFEFVCAGILEQVPAWRPSATAWADLVISDMVGFGNLATSLEKMKVPYLGFNPIADLIELDRSKQMELFRRFSVQIPETEAFSTPDQAKVILEDWQEPGYVIKPSGNLDTGKTMVVRSPEIFEWALEQFAGDQDLVVQGIEEGIEISTEGWFDGRDWIAPFNHTIEYKKLFPGDIGVNTGCMGNVVWKTKENEFTKNLERLAPFLRAAGFRGPIDINTIANKTGIYALEITARFGYDAIEALYETLGIKDLAGILSKIAGQSSKNRTKITIPIKKGFGIAVRLSVPPYPFDKADKDKRGRPIVGIDKSLESIYPTDIYFNKGMFRWAASDGVLMKVGSFGKSVDEAIGIVYNKIESIETEGLQYRDDIGKDVDRKITQLKAWGYL